VLLGTYSHALDEKGRVVLPAKFRRDLEEGSVLTKGEDGCLELFPNETWAEEVKGILDEDRRRIEVRRRRRLRFGEAHPITPDKQGRIAIPQELRDFAGLAGEVTLVGVVDRVEIWEPAAWLTEAARAEQDTVES
jgi:MraZ protein